MEGTNGASRMDRLEGLMELLIDDHLKFADEHKLLLTSQVLLTDRMDKLTGTMQELAEAQKQTERQLKDTDERLGIVLHMVDDLVRKREIGSPGTQ